MTRISTVIMHNLLNDILDFSKIEAGRLKLEAISFDPRKVIDSVVDLQHLHAEEKSIQLSSCVADDVPVLVIGDPNRLRQIVLNLVSNAIKFTQYGEVAIECSAAEGESAPLDHRHVHLRFSVRDSGIGIEKEKIEMIFEAFTQADSSTTRKFGGVGLGLNISSELVAMMGGRIWVESQPRRGSTFHFTCRFVTESSGKKREEARVERFFSDESKSGTDRLLEHAHGGSRVQGGQRNGAAVRDISILEGEVFDEDEAMRKAAGHHDGMIKQIKDFLHKAPSGIEILRRGGSIRENAVLVEQEMQNLKEMAMRTGALNFADELFCLLLALRNKQDMSAGQVERLENEFYRFQKEPRIRHLVDPVD